MSCFKQVFNKSRTKFLTFFWCLQLVGDEIADQVSDKIDLMEFGLVQNRTFHGITAVTARQALDTGGVFDSFCKKIQDTIILLSRRLAAGDSFTVRVQQVTNYRATQLC